MESPSAAGPSSLPTLSADLKKLSNDLAKAVSIEDMEALEHRVERLRSEVQSSVERIEQDKWEAQQPWRKGTWKPGTYLEVAHSSTVGETIDAGES